MSYEFRGFYIPDYMQEGIDRWVNHGILPGDFLTAVLTNNLFEAVARADEENLHNLPAYVGYFYNEVPGSCWGSIEKVKSWMKKFDENKE